MISDSSPLAGLPVGNYGEWAVDPSGKIVVAGTPYLAGSNQGLEAGLNHLHTATGWPIDQLIATVTGNPARVLGQNPPRLAAGEPANLVLFRHSSEIGFKLVACYCHDSWSGATEPNAI